MARERVSEVAKTLMAGAERLYDDVDRILGSLSPTLRNILIGTEHKSLAEAVLADLVDVLPVLGDVSNALRAVDAGRRGVEYRKRRLAAQVLDLMLGVVPEPVGAVLDALSPTNTLAYLSRRGRR